MDVVVELKSSFHGDVSRLPIDEKSLYCESFNNAEYVFRDFRSDILAALRDYYGYSVISEGRKSLKVDNPSGGRLRADVVVCQEYRKYLSFQNLNNQKYVEGMRFYVPSESRWIISYPKIHYNNGVMKNNPSATDGWYKPTVRLFKNARSYLIDQKEIIADIAPSYFLEGLIYNVPNDKFGINFNTTVYNILCWLNEADYSDLISQDEQLGLFGDTPEQWSEANARKLANSLIDLWNKW